MRNITAIILAKDEEQTIAQTIESASFCNEIIVVDDFSTDKTAQIAINKKCTVVQRSVNGDFAQQRNWVMHMAKHEWIFFVDADECISPELKNEIVNLDDRSISAYSVPRKDFFWGKELRYGETMAARKKGIIRLVKKGSGTWKGAVHETYYTKNLYRKTKNCLIHHPHSSVAEFISSINTYSTLRAKELHDAGRKANIRELILFPLAKFVYTYFFLLGFLDGVPGFIYSFCMSFHSFLVRAKLRTYYD